MNFGYFWVGEFFSGILVYHYPPPGRPWILDILSAEHFFRLLDFLCTRDRVSLYRACAACCWDMFKSRALGTVGSAMTVGSLIHECLHSKNPVWREKTRLTSPENWAAATRFKKSFLSPPHSRTQVEVVIAAGWRLDKIKWESKRNQAKASRRRPKQAVFPFMIWRSPRLQLLKRWQLFLFSSLRHLKAFEEGA